MVRAVSRPYDSYSSDVPRRNDREALACVLGGMEVVAALGRTGIRCAVPVRRGGSDRTKWSRHVVDTIDMGNAHDEADAVYVERLLAWAHRQTTRPVLYYVTDPGLVMVSRHRDTLRAGLRFVVSDADLVEDLTDKARFAQLCARVGLPAPRATVLPEGLRDAADALRFPVVIKPVTHAHRFGPGKAARVATPDELVALWQRIERPGLQVVAQELVPGPETRVESYHAYVDSTGNVVAEFTGQKMRTEPDEFGWSTRVRITDSDDVRAMGRAIVDAVGLKGVCKIDLKRDDDGRLWLLEINPRFNLWHNPAAVAGVNLPALVYADLTGTARPVVGPVRPGVTWIDPFQKPPGVRLWSWLRAVVTSDSHSRGQWSDPLPLLRIAGRRAFRKAARASLSAVIGRLDRTAREEVKH